MLRCAWAKSPLMAAYHDAEWGRPERRDDALFELLTLEGAQAGLSWETVLRKRDGYRAVFDGFDPALVAGYDELRIAAIAADPRIIRHRGKVGSTVGNARAMLAVQADIGSFAAYLWGFVEGQTIVTRRPMTEPLPATTPLSDRISADLRRRGFRFVGSTIVYAFLQATGIVDDHQIGCFRTEPD